MTYKKRDISLRFWEKVDQRDPDDCWVWIGSKTPLGYGHISKDNKTIYSHRLSWILHFGEIPDGLFVLHQCDNPSCINPAHLFLGTQLDNVHDRDQKGRGNWNYNNRANPRRGENHCSSKLTNEIVWEAREAIKSGDKFALKKMAQRYGVSYTTIWKAARGYRWGHLKSKD